MSGSVRVQLVELDSGRAVPLTGDGVSAGGPSADIVLRGAETLLAFVDPIDEGFVITDAGLAAVTVNDAPVIGQRLARVGDQIAFAERTYRIEAMAEAVPAAVLEPALVVEPVLDVEPTLDVEPMLAVEPEALHVAVPEVVASEIAPPTPQVPERPSALRALLGWLLVIVVVLGSGAAGYLVAAMLRGGR